MVNIAVVKLSDLLPDSIKHDEQVVAAAAALDGELAAVTEAIKETILLTRIDELPESVIDLLAWQWHVDFYDTSLPVEKKRDFVKQTVSWHKRKGTPQAVQEMLSTIFSTGTVAEWWEYGGDPYHFRVNITQELDDDSAADKATQLIEAVKNVRSWLDNINITREEQSDIFVGIAKRQSIHTIIAAAEV